MKQKKKQFIYISNKEYDGTVFQTQVLDWLTLFREKGVRFRLYQAFHIKDLRRPGFCRSQASAIRRRYSDFGGGLFFFPSVRFFAWINAMMLYLKILRLMLTSAEVVLFSRGLLGKEMAFLKRLPGPRVTFLFDARAASAEENRYAAIKTGNFRLKKYRKIAHIAYTEYITLSVADRVFAVSDNLMAYFESAYRTGRDKYVPYPCLSDHRKFYYSEEIRAEQRKELSIPEGRKVVLYSGGLSEEWHVAADMFRVFRVLMHTDPGIRFLILSRDQKGLQKYRSMYPELFRNVTAVSAANEEVFRYLNAADFGILFRENTPMNNVASPTKFAEYLLCGLPVIISEGVGDYTEFTRSEGCGYVLSQKELKEPDLIDVEKLLGMPGDRRKIADIGVSRLSKHSMADRLTGVFNAL